ncbi:hypothetical protein FACS1894152_0890 [Bacilli bacterium]|nr:hypothetical protein FACS1894152_0890 [Bacilli bacterium]
MFKTTFLSIFLLYQTNVQCLAKKVDKKNETTIESDEVKIKKNQNIMIFKGNIRIKKEDLTITTPKTATVYYAIDNGRIELKNIDMVDVVAIKDNGIRLSGDRGSYNLESSILTIENNVIISEKNSVIFVDKAVYNTISEEIDMFGNKKTKKNPKRNVVIIIDNIDKVRNKHDSK